ncbi:hypothetical protein CTAYLR_002303 [Chrysophaeum taylorii]|uniref:PPPDE domain-containing protein n=1 Tax=Chrysophaeum taylorii TaxID=2483200 RepID=A0AAD7UNU9_9STRA|nr:hypothetical protein CTAYLR_002303 [Chrysophaeum taylorii]
MTTTTTIAVLASSSGAYAFTTTTPRTIRRPPRVHAQVADYASALWDREEFPPVLPTGGNVECTVYDIGGGLTQVLSKTCSKELPLIPHVGVRVYGREYFYSDHIESRSTEVMAEMLSSFPQISFDLGEPKMTRAELDEWLASPDLQRDWQPENYNVFDHNCNHFAKVMMDRVASRPLEPELIEPVLKVTEEMLSELPEWRRNLGLALMNQVTRLVVVSWGRATKKKKQQLEVSARNVAASDRNVTLAA